MVKILGLVFFIGCASSNHIDKRVKPYVKKFETLYGEKIGSIDIFIQPFPKRHKTAGGVCRIIDQTILINEYHWNKKDTYEKEMVVFHELGHCELGLAHDYQNRKDMKCFDSIMNWQSMPGQCYKNKIKYYREEFFNRERKHRWRIIKLRQK